MTELTALCINFSYNDFAFPVRGFTENAINSVKLHHGKIKSKKALQGNINKPDN